MTMKKYINIFAVLAMALFVGSCEDELEQEFQYIKVVPGEEIQFGASAAFESSVGSTRTIYGDINKTDGLIEVNWVPNQDRIQIISPHAGGADIAEYQVISTNNETVTPGNGTDGEFKEFSQATTLQRIGEAGLQWTNATEYDFYAMYPSHEQLKEVVKEVENTGDYGLKNVYDESGLPVSGTMIGYLPVTQDPVTTDPAPAEDGGSRVVKVQPDMRYAYMAAKAHYEIPEDGKIKDAIQLNFQSLVTALEFDITVNEIVQQSDGTQLIDIMGLMLTSKDYDICGKFVYTFPEGSTTDISDGSIAIQNATTQNYRSITMGFGQNGIQGLAQGDVVKATFFILPSAGIENEFKAGDLKLTVMFKVAGQPQIKTATIKKAISPCKYTHFTDVLLPKIDNKVDGSTWFSALSDNIYVSQISIPVASNVFAHKDYGFETKSIQQVQTYTELWDMGVRGFELVTRRAVTKSGTRYTTNNTWSLKTAHFVCDEVAHEVFDNTSDDYIDFGIAFETLLAKLRQNPNETLVLICTYQAISDGYDPNGYVKQLLNYFDDLVENKIVSMDDFVQLHANSTVEDIRGKICVIIRPGDDDRFENLSHGVLYSKDIVLSSNDGTNSTDWSKNLLLIQDWGTAFDVWDRRYEGVAREAQFDISYRNPVKKLAERPYVENLLWGVSSSSSTYTQPTDKNGNTNASNNNFNNFGVNLSKKAQFEYKHTLSDGGTAYVQEWARVVPSSMTGKIYTKKSASSHHMWVQWPESYSEKLAAIDSLFKKSVATKGTSNISSLYINSLSGYYITDTYMQGLYPFLNKYSFKHYYDGLFVDEWLTGTFSLSDMGKGGDHVALAYDLNKYVYGILSGTGKMQDGSSLAEGPWGLVMMEHIGNTTKGADDKSVALVNLIMMNNFRFPLAQKTDVEGVSVQRIPLSDESVDINKNIMVTWE